MSGRYGSRDRHQTSGRAALCRPPASILTSGVGAQLADAGAVMLAEDVGQGNARVRLGRDRLGLAHHGHLSGTYRFRTGPPRSAEESPPLIAEGHTQGRVEAVVQE